MIAITTSSSIKVNANEGTGAGRAARGVVFEQFFMGRPQLCLGRMRKSIILRAGIEETMGGVTAPALNSRGLWPLETPQKKNDNSTLGTEHGISTEKDAPFFGIPKLFHFNR